jgi:hypothetical protein
VAPLTAPEAKGNPTLLSMPTLSGEWWGMLDPSVIDGPVAGELYLSFSDVVPSFSAAGPLLVSTALAKSTDGGESWTRLGTIAQSRQVSDTVLEMNEISSIVHDPADARAPYKILWLRFLNKKGEPDWRDSWISMRTALSPEGTWSEPIKLIAPKAYDPRNTSHPEPREPRFALPVQMQDCLILQEPGTLSAPDGFYLSINCISTPRQPQGTRLELLKFTHRSSGETVLEYKGALFTYDDARRFKAAYTGQYPALRGAEAELGASDMFSADGRTYLLASPVTAGGTYMGCGVFEITDIEKAEVRRDENGVPLMLTYIPGTGDIHRGACTYAANSTAAGVLMNRVQTNPGAVPPLRFEAVTTGLQIP